MTTMTTDDIRVQATPLWLTDDQARLLANAELAVIEGYCQNHCIHHSAFQPCYECPRFSVPVAGYIVCDGYEQAGEVDAA